jgi:hypothetical protein
VVAKIALEKRPLRMLDGANRVPLNVVTLDPESAMTLSIFAFVRSE